MKHSYQTRRLLALRDMRHDGQNVVAGDEVFATETDASYLIRTGGARDPEQQTQAPAAETTAPRRGRVARTVKAPVVNTPAEDNTPDGADAGDGAGESGDPQAN